jgi:hypothetical protein
VRVLVRLVEQLLAGNDRVEQPHLVSALGRDEVGAQEELHRVRERDLARESHRGPSAGEQAALGLHHRELRLGARDADVDAPQHLHPAGGAEAVHGRDDRLPDLRPAQHRLRAVVEPVTVDLAEALVLNPLGNLGDLGDVLLEVGAGEEGVAHARDDGDPRLGVVVEALPRHAELLEVLHVGRVAGLGPIDRDADDVVVVPFVMNRHPYLPPAVPSLPGPPAYLANLTR